jgi:hypothetical protein
MQPGLTTSAAKLKGLACPRIVIIVWMQPIWSLAAFIQTKH